MRNTVIYLLFVEFLQKFDLDPGQCSEIVVEINVGTF